MIKQFEKLTNEERGLLYKAPVLVSVLASCSFNEVNKHQKADAIKLAHLKTFTAAPLLRPYYAEVEKTFKEQFEAAIKKYFPFDDAKRNDLKKEIERVNLIIGKLDKEYAHVLHDSLEEICKACEESSSQRFSGFHLPCSYSWFNGLIRMK